MAKTFTAPFPQTAKTATAITAAACVIGTADAPTNVVQLLTVGTEGAVLTNLSVMPRATVTATALYLFLSKDSGTTKRLIDSELMPAYTLAATTAIPETQFARYSEATPLRLDAGDQLYVGCGVAFAAGLVHKAEYTEYL